MPKCNKFKKRWKVMESDTDVFPAGSIYQIKEDDPDVFQVDIETGGPPPGGSLSNFVCEQNELIGSYTDPEGSSYPMKMTLALDQNGMQGCVGQQCFEAGRGSPAEDDPVGTWGAEEDPPSEKEKNKKEKGVSSSR
ncbi:MAG TPA: hypothetical protein VLU25_01485 [Acidobacteriota bacterium]|nr:hypothetical protein [Acidobacteriota bacterium]